MSWPIPNTGPWNPGMAMAPDMNNMGNYTPEQWFAMQQQNWQQWSQWQQQYAQWQNQYGEKYAEQMRVIQAMGGMPPLPPPSAAPPPAPPPPDKPPPPPHENNQPLYAETPSQPVPVPAPSNNQTPVKLGINTNHDGNKSNWSHSQEALSSVDADALKKLAEEERLFDIQFQKWEEEIEKWKKDNVNHPDKQAYKEYEEKFESCRAQLLERRQQMDKKKARLLGAAPPPPPPQPPSPAPANPNTSVPPPLITSMNNAYSNNQQNYGSKTQNLNAPPPNYGNNSTPKPPHSYGEKPQVPYKQNYTDNLQNNYGNDITKNQQPNYGMNTPQNNFNQSSLPYQQYKTMQNQNTFSRNNNYCGDTQNQDTYDSYSHDSNDNYPSQDSFSQPSNPSFLLASESNKKDIPGLDLVPDADRKFGSNVNQDVIDITDDAPINKNLKKGPDYSTISQGINNILRDDKIMNILSMVRVQGGPDFLNNQSQVSNNQSGQFGNNIQDNPPFDQGYINQNQQFNNQQNDTNRQNMPYNKPTVNYPMQQNQGGPRNPPQRFMDERQDDMQQDQYNFGRNSQYGKDMAYDNGPPRGLPPGRNNFAGMKPPGQPLRDPPGRQNEYNFSSGPPPTDRLGVTDFSRAPPGVPPPERRPLNDNNVNPIPPQPPRPQWIDEPMFSPSLIVEYEHKPLRLKARDFIEPVHMFEYNHKSKDEDVKKRNFDKEADELFARKPRRNEDDYGGDRYHRDYYSRDFERRAPRDDLREEFRPRVPPRDGYDDRDVYMDRRRLDEERRRPEKDRRRLEDDRRRVDSRFDERRRDDRDKYTRRDDVSRERDRDVYRDRDQGRETRREDEGHIRNRERDTRKRGLSIDSEHSDSVSKKAKEKVNIPASQFEQPSHIVMIDDLLESPGRDMRPEKIAIILRGPPGSGKSYLAKLIRDKEAEYGGTVRIMSIDDYFMQEGEVEEKDPNTGKMVKKPTLKYEYDASSEEAYVNSLKRAFKRSLIDGYFSFIIYDAVNDTLKSYADVWNICRQNDFQVYICTMELDPQTCHKRNIHNRDLGDIEAICARFYPTPHHHIQLDATTLLQSGAITEVHMEDADDEVVMEDAQEPEVDSVFTSKWEKMDDAVQLARLDGTSKPLRSSQLSMEDYLQLDDWKPTTAKPGKKTVRWADIEERRQQDKMRAIGFVVGQTDWNRMTDPTMGSSALTQTKYIERVRRS